MSAIDELVAELCPNGVEYRKLNEVCLIETGRLNAKAAVENGAYCFFTTAEEVSKIDTYRWDTEALLIAGNANVGSVKHFKGKFEAYQRTYVLTQFVSDIQPRYLYHYLEAHLKDYLADKSNSAAMTYIVLSTLQDFPIPVPPIEVQREIVRILDTFTELTDTLTEELDCRRQQYAYYRDRLLSRESLEALDGKPVEMVKLGDVGQMAMCKRIFKSQTGKEGDIPFFKIGTFGGIPDAYINRELYEEYRDKYRFPKVGDILISASGTIGRTVTYHGEDAYFQDSNIVWLEHDESRVLNTYLKYMYSTLEWKVDGGTIKRLYSSAFHAVEIPVPSLETQQKVVDILDRFDALTTSLTDGLPAEIEARRTQYAYYRDRLLDFQRKEVAAS